MSTASHPIRLFASLMVAGVLTPVTFIAGVGVVTDEGPLRPIWGMMAVFGAVAIVDSLYKVWTGVRLKRKEAAQLRASRSPLAASAAVARWSVDRAAAIRFADAEWARRKIEVAVGAAFLFVAGAGFIWWAEDAEPFAAIATGGFLGTLYFAIGFGKYSIEHANARKPGADEVVVLEDAVVVLGSRHGIAGDRALIGVALTDAALELTVRWQTRNGPAEDTIRLPVPADAREQAAYAAQVLGDRVNRG